MKADNRMFPEHRDMVIMVSVLAVTYFVIVVAFAYKLAPHFGIQPRPLW